MNRLTRSIVAVSCAVGIGAGLTACSSPTPQENESAACSGYLSLANSVQDAKSSLGESPTVGDLRTARDSVRSSYDELQDDLGNVAQDRATAVSDAVSNFEDAVSNLDNDTAVADAKATLVEDVNAIGTALDNLNEDLKC
jgi:hypothetical protein